MKHVAIFTLVLVVALLTVTTLGVVDLLGAINGKVYDTATGDRVAGAWVGVLGTNLGVATDSTGRFRIGNVNPGIHEVVVSHPEYFGLTYGTGVEVTVQAGQTQTISIPMIGCVRGSLGAVAFRTLAARSGQETG